MFPQTLPPIFPLQYKMIETAPLRASSASVYLLTDRWLHFCFDLLFLPLQGHSANGSLCQAGCCFSRFTVLLGCNFRFHQTDSAAQKKEKKNGKMLWREGLTFAIARPTMNVVFFFYLPFFPFASLLRCNFLAQFLPFSGRSDDSVGIGRRTAGRGAFRWIFYASFACALLSKCYTL